MKPLRWPLLLIPFLCACQSRDLNFYIRFDELNRLQTGDRVFLAGREAGKVEAIQPTDGGVQVAVRIDVPLRHQVTRGARYTVATDPTAPARQSIQITPDPKCEPIQDSAVVEGGEPKAFLFSPLLKEFGKSLKALKQEFQDLSQALEKLPASPQFRDLEQSLQELARQMREAEEKLQEDVLPRLRQEIERLHEELEKQPKGKTLPDSKTIAL